MIDHFDTQITPEELEPPYSEEDVRDAIRLQDREIEAELQHEDYMS